MFYKSKIKKLISNISNTKIDFEYSVFFDDSNRKEEQEIAKKREVILKGERKDFFRYSYFSSNTKFNSIPFYANI